MRAKHVNVYPSKKNLVMTSAYDLPSVQTLGEGGRESEVSPSGEEYAIAEVKFCIFKHLVRFGGKSHDRPAF